jgi:hypothetical protein
MFIWCIRYWYVLLSTLLSLVLFGVIEFVNNRLIALVAIVLYLLLVGLMYRRVYIKSIHKITIATTILVCALGALGVLLLIEVVVLRRLFACLLSIIIGAIFYIPQRFSAQLAHEYKPWRRMFVSIMTLGVWSVVTTLYGLDMFFQFPGIGWYACAATAIASFMAYAIFRLYYPDHTHRMFVWTLILALISFQLFLTISYLPLGYLWLGLVFILVWYTAITTIRFHLSPKGLVWQKQRYFLSGAAITFVLLLVFAKWV